MFPGHSLPSDSSVRQLGCCNIQNQTSIRSDVPSVSQSKMGRRKVPEACLLAPCIVALAYACFALPCAMHIIVHSHCMQKVHLMID